jgi:hypothetical protein
MLDYIHFSHEDNMTPSLYHGAQPSHIVVTEANWSAADFESFATMLPTVTTLSVWFENDISTRLKDWIPLGALLGRVEHLSFSSQKPAADHPSLLASWIPHMKSLKKLGPTWRFKSGPAMLDALRTSKVKLEELKLYNGVEDDEDHAANCLNAATFSKFQDLADRMPQVERLVLPGECFEEFTSTEGVQRLQSLEKAFAKSNISLKDVYVVAKSFRENSTDAFFVQLYGYLFAVESDRNILKWHIDKIIELGFENLAPESDVLLFSLSGGLPDMAPLKVEMLLDAGADPLKKCPDYLGGFFGYTVGNALHIAACFSTEQITEVLLSRIKWDLLSSIDDLRMSNGLLPIHLSPCDFGAWQAIYNRLKSRFPTADLLQDDANVQGMMPIESILMTKETGYSDEAVYSTMEFILRECPQAASHSRQRRPNQGSLTSLCMERFCHFTVESSFSPRAFEIIQRIVAVEFPDLAQRGPCTLQDLGFELNDTRYRGFMLFACSFYAPQIFDLVIAQQTSAERACCLHALMSRPPVPNSVDCIRKVLSLGFDLILPNELVSDPISEFHPLWHYLAEHWNGDPTFDPVEDYLANHEELDKQRCKSFWDCFWELVDAFEAGGQPGFVPEEMYDVLPLGDELIVFSEVNNILRFMEWGATRCRLLIRNMRQDIIELHHLDKAREAEGKQNRFSALFETISKNVKAAK